jgi:hypothetical protein
VYAIQAAQADARDAAVIAARAYKDSFPFRDHLDDHLAAPIGVQAAALEHLTRVLKGA